MIPLFITMKLMHFIFARAEVSLNDKRKRLHRGTFFTSLKSAHHKDIRRRFTFHALYKNFFKQDAISS